MELIGGVKPFEAACPLKLLFHASTPSFASSPYFSATDRSTLSKNICIMLAFPTKVCAKDLGI